MSSAQDKFDAAGPLWGILGIGISALFGLWGAIAVLAMVAMAFLVLGAFWPITVPWGLFLGTRWVIRRLRQQPA